MTEEEVEILVLHVLIEERGAAREYAELRVALGTGKLHLDLGARGIRVHHRDVAHVRAASVREGELARLRAARIADVHGQRPAWPRERAGGKAIRYERRGRAHGLERVRAAPEPLRRVG